MNKVKLKIRKKSKLQKVILRVLRNSSMKDKLACVTENKVVFIIEIKDREYFIKETTAKYLRESILDKKCREPKENMPLEIFLNAIDILTTSKVISIRKLGE